MIAQIGTGGGQGYVLEYRGNVIENLSMEARMTICNMSIEAGARAGHDRPGRDDVRLPEGPRPRADRAPQWDEAVADVARAAHRRRRGVRRRGRHRRRRAHPVRHLGHQPGPGAAAGRAGAGPGADRRRERARRRREGADLHGPRGRHAAARDPRRHRVRRLLHQRPDRGPARRRRRSSRAARSPTACACWWCPARCGCGSRPRTEGLDEVFTRRRRRVALGGLLDVPGHEPGPARAGRAQRVDVQPQLRGPPGQGRPHPPGVPAGRRRHRRPRHPELARRT